MQAGGKQGSVTPESSNLVVKLHDSYNFVFLNIKKYFKNYFSPPHITQKGANWRKIMGVSHEFPHIGVRANNNLLVIHCFVDKSAVARLNDQHQTASMQATQYNTVVPQVQVQSPFAQNKQHLTPVFLEASLILLKFSFLYLVCLIFFD
jgi:hypothetical protein